MYILYTYIYFFKCFIERAEKQDTYLYIILNWNIFFITILCIF